MSLTPCKTKFCFENLTSKEKYWEIYKSICEIKEEIEEIKEEVEEIKNIVENIQN